MTVQASRNQHNNVRLGARRLRVLIVFAFWTLLGMSAAFHTTSDASELSGRSEPLGQESQALLSTLNAFTPSQAQLQAPQLRVRGQRGTRSLSPLYWAGILAVLALTFLVTQRFRMQRSTKRKPSGVSHGPVPQRMAQRQGRSILQSCKPECQIASLTTSATCEHQRRMRRQAETSSKGKNFADGIGVTCAKKTICVDFQRKRQKPKVLLAGQAASQWELELLRLKPNG